MAGGGVGETWGSEDGEGEQGLRAGQREDVVCFGGMGLCKRTGSRVETLRK